MYGKGDEFTKIKKMRLEYYIQVGKIRNPQNIRYMRERGREGRRRRKKKMNKGKVKKQKSP